MLRFEHCKVNACVNELLALGNHNDKMWNIFSWLASHDELQYGTQAEIIKLYVDNTLIGYSLFENYEARNDKIIQHKEKVYRELGVVHFITLNAHRNKGYASLLADSLFTNIIAPMLARHQDVYAYVVATGRAAPLMERTKIPANNLIKQFYSDASFEEKVVNYLKQLAH